MTSEQKQGYLKVNGLDMYYEIHGEGQPLVLIHGAFSAIGSSFGAVLPELARSRQVIGLEMQAHGHTADIDRPLSMEQMADDTAVALHELGIAQADILGYSMGAGVALRLAIRHPKLVRKLIFMSAAFAMDGVHPRLMDGLGEMTPEMMFGSPWHDEYLSIAPDPDHFAEFFAKKTAMDHQTTDIPSEDIRNLPMPVLIILGDSDLARPEHAVEMFRLLGGGVFGDMAGMPDSQLAILPGTMHTSIINQVPMLVAMIPPFLDAPLPEKGAAQDQLTD